MLKRVMMGGKCFSVMVEVMRGNDVLGFVFFGDCGCYLIVGLVYSS